MAGSSRLKTLSLFAVMLMCATTAFVVIDDSDDSDAAVSVSEMSVSEYDSIYGETLAEYISASGKGTVLLYKVTFSPGDTFSNKLIGYVPTNTTTGYLNTELVNYGFTPTYESAGTTSDGKAYSSVTVSGKPTGTDPLDISYLYNTEPVNCFAIYIEPKGSSSIPVTDVSISGSTSVNIGSTITLTATTSPTNATDRHVTWTITSGSSRATINSTSNTSSGGTCVIEGVSAGSVIVKATASDGSGKSATKTITVNAEETTYYLNFDKKGGSGGPSDMSQSSTASSYTFTIPYTEPTKNGYTFKGWSTSSAATTAQKQPGETISISSNTTLYAVWEENAKNTFAIVYNVNGGTGSISGSNYSSHDTTYSFTVTSSVPTAPAGKEFKGWSTTSTGSVEKVVGNTVTCNANSTVTLYAVYEDIVYTYAIAYHANGGTDAPASTTGTSTGSFLMLTVTSEEPTYPGMIFLGWSEDRNAASPTYYAGNSIKVTSTTTLYAVWKEAHITVSGNPVKTTVAGNSWSYTPTVSEVGTTLKVSGASWMSVVNGTIVGTPTTPGEYNVTITAEKTGFSNGTQTFTVTVIPALSFSSAPTGGVIAYAV